MKVTRYEIEYEDEPIEVVYIDEKECVKLFNDWLFLRNVKQLRTIKEIKEERWLCQTENAVGKMCGKEYVIRDGQAKD